jgi:ubiquinone/menaquinone biosynthesis C-methylase UbiE
MASAICPLDFYDYRPAEITLPGLTCRHGNLLDLGLPDDSVESLSCMHVVEHIGLERYGDPFDPQGDLKAIGELQRVAQSGGNVLFVVPIGGRAKIQYNAHRVYTYRQILSYFDQCSLKEFSLVTDSGSFIADADERLVNSQSYGCGCFWLRKG